MRVALPLILLTAALPLAACSGGEKAHVSNATADLSQLRNFTSVALTGPDDVVITVGPEIGRAHV